MGKEGTETTKWRFCGNALMILQVERLARDLCFQMDLDISIEKNGWIFKDMWIKATRERKNIEIFDTTMKQLPNCDNDM